MNTRARPSRSDYNPSIRRSSCFATQICKGNYNLWVAWELIDEGLLTPELPHFLKYAAKFLTYNTETNRHGNILEVRNLQVAFFV